jgi:hypothetical protein
VIYELPEYYDYKIYNVKGELYQSGSGEKVDITEYKNGVYFIKYEDQTRRFEVTHQPEEEKKDN